MKENIEFDSLGYIQPSKGHPMTLGIVEELFTQGVAGEERRRKLFENFLRFLEDLKETSLNIKEIWINGSFANRTSVPNDIDLVIFVEEPDPENRWSQIKTEYKPLGLDAYMVTVFPEGDHRTSWTETDYLYWEHQFTRERRTKKKNRKTIQKGFIILEYV
ncbi:MAG: nucleotidyltransferase domain-containing protein [Bacteroidota bacterium]